MSVVGERKLKERLLAFELLFPAAVKEALIEEAMEIFAKSQKQVPVDTGRLRDSGIVGEGQHGDVTIAYGTDYALPVHERTEVKHTVGKAKFLEDPFLEAIPGLESRLLARTKRKVNRFL